MDMTNFWHKLLLLCKEKKFFITSTLYVAKATNMLKEVLENGMGFLDKIGPIIKELSCPFILEM